MKYLIKFNEGVIDLFRNKYRKFLNDVEEGSYLRDWEIEDSVDKIILKSEEGVNINLILVPVCIHVEIDISKNTIVYYSTSNRPDLIGLLDPVTIKISKSKISEIARSIRKTKELSDEISDITIDLSDMGFDIGIKYCGFSRTILVTIRRDDRESIECDDDFFDDIDGIVKRCKSIGLSVLYNNADYIRTNGSIEKTWKINLHFKY